MTFQRTNSGIATLHTFYNVDIIIFCEGSKSSASDFLSDDELFWQGIGRYLDDARVKTKCIGSRFDVLEAFDRAKISGATNIAFAIDRDWHGEVTTIENDLALLVTKGCAWENDCLSSSKLYSYIRDAVPGGALFEDELAQYIEKFHTGLERLVAVVRSDCVQIQLGLSGVVPRAGVGKSLVQMNTLNCDFDLAALEDRVICSPVEGVENLTQKTDVEYVKENLYGHLLLGSLYQFCRPFVEKCFRAKTPESFFRSLVIKLFWDHIDDYEELKAHYEGCATAIRAIYR
jgi:hypothetical protein